MCEAGRHSICRSGNFVGQPNDVKRAVFTNLFFTVAPVSLYSVTFTMEFWIKKTCFAVHSKNTHQYQTFALKRMTEFSRRIGRNNSAHLQHKSPFKSDSHNSMRPRRNNQHSSKSTIVPLGLFLKTHHHDSLENTQIEHVSYCRFQIN